jgi:hypothetical protein
MTSGMYLIFATAGSGPRLPDLRLLAAPGSPEFQIPHLAEFYLSALATHRPITLNNFLAYAAAHPGTLPSQQVQPGDGMPQVDYVYRLTLADPHHQLLLEVIDTVPGVGDRIPSPITGSGLLPVAAAMCDRLADRAERFVGTHDGFTIPGGDAERSRLRTRTYRERQARTVNGQPSIGDGDEPLIAFDPAACRDWLAGGAAAEAGIDDGFRSENLTVAAGIEQLLDLLNQDATARCWRPAPQLHKVLIWRTGDGDGIDGGGLLTVDLDYPCGRIRLGCLHQGFDDFIRDPASHGVDAAVEALGHVADLVNHTYATFRAATTVRPAPPENDDATANPG